eukprot:357033-Chlamydomonas_euryale.AAC.12
MVPRCATRPRAPSSMVFAGQGHNLNAMGPDGSISAHGGRMLWQQPELELCERGSCAKAAQAVARLASRRLLLHACEVVRGCEKFVTLEERNERFLVSRSSDLSPEMAFSTQTKLATASTKIKSTAKSSGESGSSDKSLAYISATVQEIRSVGNAPPDLVLIRTTRSLSGAAMIRPLAAYGRQKH